ncbi:MAG: hypothetical protein M5U26_22640 [Planctomycetota bacterium]|nr:hypothetical protein [Planctomycetota bacterium]
MWAMSEFLPSRVLSREDVVGRRIRAVYSEYERNEDSELDCVSIYFILDNGICFTMPFVGCPWESTQLPAAARAIENLDILGACLVGVFIERLEPTEPAWDLESAKLRIEDGRWVWVMPASPFGTGGAGLYVDAASRYILAEQFEFWES